MTTFEIQGTATVYSGINNAGEIVGTLVDATSVQHGFVQNGGSYTTLDVPGATNTWLNGVNNVGEIVGGFTDALGYHGFVYDGATYTTLDVPSANQGTTEARGINDAGAIVGVFNDAAGRHGFLYDGASYTTLDHGGPAGMYASGIDDAGLIAGEFFDAAYAGHGRRCDLHDVRCARPSSDEREGTHRTVALGINNRAEIVGWFLESETGLGLLSGFLWSGGTYTEFAVPGSLDTYLYGINEAGQTVGDIGDTSGIKAAFLATPISLGTQISLSSTSLMEVTIFGSASLDVTTLDPTALRLGPKRASPDPDFGNPALIEDANGDGFPDLVVLFREEDTGLPSGVSQACFTGTLSSQTFLGCDPIVKLPTCGLGFELTSILPTLLWLRGRRRHAPACSSV